MKPSSIIRFLACFISGALSVFLLFCMCVFIIKNTDLGILLLILAVPIPLMMLSDYLKRRGL